MITTISPLVKAGWPSVLLIAVHVVASTFSAAAVGGLLGVLGGAVLLTPETRRACIIAVAALAVVAALRDADIVAFAIPPRRGSVPQSWWRHWGHLKAAAAYGAVLGLGFTTPVPFAGF